MKIDHTNRAHAVLGGSSAARWLACPASVALVQTVPATPPSEAAIEGTEVHEVCQIVLEDFLEHKIAGTDPSIRSHLLVDNDSYLESAYLYRDLIWDKVLGQSITGKAWGTEEVFTFDERFKSFGTVDFWTIYPDNRARRVCAVVDYKNGFYEVDAEKNDQLLFYAAAILNEIRAGGKDLDLFRCIIIQPKSANPYKEVVYTTKKIETWTKKALDVAYKIFVTKKVSYKTGKHCRFCQAQNLCEKYAKELAKDTALSLLKIEDENLEVNNRINDDVIKSIVLNEGKLLNFIKACKKYAMGKALSGSLPGMKVVMGPSRRKWGKEEVAVQTLSCILDKDDIYNQKLKGIGDIEKKLKAKGHPKEEVTKILEPLVAKTDPPLLLVEANDPREGISQSVANLLGDETEEEG